MNDLEFDAVQGQIAALAKVMQAVICQLPGDAANAAAIQLQAELDVQNEADAQEQTAELTTRTRNDIGSGFVRLLLAVSRRG